MSWLWQVMNRQKMWTDLPWKHLLFDLDNTLWDFETNSSLALQQTLARFFKGFEKKELQAALTFFEKTNRELWQLYARQKINKKELQLQRFKLLLVHLKKEPATAGQLNDVYTQRLPLQTNLMPDTIAILQYLSAKGYHLHVITNGLTAMQQQKMESSKIATYFHSLTTSELAGYSKPDKRIFQYALTHSNIRRQESLIIGDSEEMDIAGAHRAGISSILINKCPVKTLFPPQKRCESRFSHTQKLTNPKKTQIIIKNLTQLKSIL